MSTFRILTFLAVASLMFSAATPALAMGTSFSYQGSLEDGDVPAHGSYDFEFRLIDSGGSTIATNLRDDVAVVRGVFTVQLNFGSAGNLFPGTFVRFLQIGIRPSGSASAYEFLAPLTPIHPAPYAQRADSVTSGAILEESIAASAVDKLQAGKHLRQQCEAGRWRGHQTRKLPAVQSPARRLPTVQSPTRTLPMVQSPTPKWRRGR